MNVFVINPEEKWTIPPIPGSCLLFQRIDELPLSTTLSLLISFPPHPQPFFYQSVLSPLSVPFLPLVPAPLAAVMSWDCLSPSLSSPPSLWLSPFRSDWRQRSTTASIGEQVNTHTHTLSLSGQKCSDACSVTPHLAIRPRSEMRTFQSVKARATQTSDQFVTMQADSTHTTNTFTRRAFLTDPEVPIGLSNYFPTSLLPQLKHSRLRWSTALL